MRVPTMNPLHYILALVAVALAVGGCAEQPDPAFRYGVDLSDWSFQLHSPNMGIHPDASVFEDPNNPFRRGSISVSTKWDINDIANNAAGFYSWATLLVLQPTGEHQFYTAEKLASLYNNREVENQWLDPVREMAIRAYQVILDSFPDSVSYDASGLYPFRLAPLAYQGIIALGGVVQGGWVEVATPNGGTTVVQVPQFNPDDEG